MCGAQKEEIKNQQWTGVAIKEVLELTGLGTT